MNAPAAPAETRQAMDTATHLTVVQQLYFEARLLDEERYDEWLALLADDLRYRMPLPERRFRKDTQAAHPFGAGHVFDEDKARLALRVGRLTSGMVWAEDPRNRVRRFVGNVEVYAADAPDSVRVHSNVDIHRARQDGAQRRLTAARADLWRREHGQWRLARRDIALDHPVVRDSNLNVFF